MSLSIFVLAYALGPLICQYLAFIPDKYDHYIDRPLGGPLSELFGRLPILQVSNIFFLSKPFLEIQHPDVLI